MTQKCNIPFKKGIEIQGELHSTKRSPTLLILCHGFTDSKDTPGIKRLAQLLEQTADVYRFTFTDNINPHLPTEVENVQVITQYFSRRYNTIVVIGASLGGLAAVLSAPRIKHMHKLILINPFAYFFKKIAWRFRKVLIVGIVLAPFVSKARENLLFYFRTFAPRSIRYPSLVVVSTHDQLVHPSHGHTLYRELASSQKKLILDDEIDHGLTKDIYLQKVARYIINWLSQ